MNHETILLMLERVLKRLNSLPKENPSIFEKGVEPMTLGTDEGDRNPSPRVGEPDSISSGAIVESLPLEIEGVKYAMRFIEKGFTRTSINYHDI